MQGHNGQLTSSIHSKKLGEAVLPNVFVQNKPEKKLIFHRSRSRSQSCFLKSQSRAKRALNKAKAEPMTRRCPEPGRVEKPAKPHLFLGIGDSDLPTAAGSGRRGRGPAATAPAHDRGHGRRRGRESAAPRR